MTYDWMAALVYLAVLVGLTVTVKFVAFKIPAFADMRAQNLEADRPKLKRDRFRAAVKQSNRSGLYTNLFFYIAILPFFLSLDPRPFWRHVVDVVVVLLVFDFFYYLTHRFLFHGKILRKVHALHHEARKPTHIDSLYVHPLETCIGLCLFLGSIPLVAFLSGATLSAYSMAVATLLFTQLNTLNHAWVNLPQFPYSIVSWITQVHAAHHVDMNQGNYATLTMFYDWLFGTFEKPVSRPSA